MRKLTRLSLILFAAFLFLTATGSLLVYVYRSDIKEYVLSYLNKNINTEVTVGSVKVGMLRHFPYISVAFHDVVIHSSRTFRRQENAPDTLLTAHEVVLDLNIYKLLTERKVKIDRLNVSKGRIEMAEGRKGENNWEIIKKGKGGATSFRVGAVKLEGMGLRYRNLQKGMFLEGDVEQATLRSERFSPRGILRLTAGNLRVTTGKKGKFFREERVEIVTTLAEEGSRYLLEDGRIRVGELPEIKFNGKVTAGSAFNLEIGFRVSRLTPEKLLPLRLSGETILPELPLKGGRFALNGRLQMEGGTSPASWMLEIELAGKDHLAEIKKVGEIRIDKWRAKYRLEGRRSGTRGFFEAGPVEVEYGEGRFSFKGNWHTGLSHLEGVVKGDFRLRDLNPFLGGPLVFREGRGKGVLKVRVPWSWVTGKEKRSWRRVEVEGKVELNDYMVFLPGKLEGKVGELRFYPRHRIGFFLPEVRGAGTLWRIQGQIMGLDEFLEKNIPVTVTGEMQGEGVSLASLSAFFRGDSSRQETEGGKSGKPVPRFDMLFSCDTFQYEDVRVVPLKGRLLFDEPVLRLERLEGKTLGGSVSGQLALRFAGEEGMAVKSYIEMEGIDVHRLFLSFHDFGQDFIRAQNLRGLLSGNIALQARFDTAGKVIPASILSDSYLLLENGALVGFEPLYKLSTFIRLSELKEIRFSRLENEIFISDKTVVIPQMRVNSSAIDLDIGGKHYFDGRFEYHIRVYLSDYLSRKARKANAGKDLDLVVAPDGRNTSLFLIYRSDGKKTRISYDRKKVRQRMSEELKKEKEELKDLFRRKEKTDTLPVREGGSEDIRVEWPEELPDTAGMRKPEDTVPKKKFRIIWEEEPDTLPNVSGR